MIGQDLDPLILVERGAPQGEPLRLGLAGQEFLREVGAVVGLIRLGGHHDDAAGESLPPQGLGRGVSRGPGSHDEEGPVLGHLHAGMLRFLRRADPDIPLLHAHGIQGKIVQGWRRDHTPRSDIQARVMAAADHDASEEKPLLQLALIVRALVPHGMDLSVQAHQIDPLLADCHEPGDVFLQIALGTDFLP